MHTEYECTLLDVDETKLIKKIENMGAIKKGEYFQKRYVYDFNPVDPSKWIRLRTNDEKTTLTIKKLNDKKKIGGTEELEIEVSNFEQTNQVLNELGYNHRNYQENKRITYVLDDIEIDIDSWPLIPTYVEFEGKNEKAVEDFIKKLELTATEKQKIVTCDVVSIYKDYYNIDIMSIKELRFNYESLLEPNKPL